MHVCIGRDAFGNKLGAFVNCLAHGSDGCDCDVDGDNGCANVGEVNGGYFYVCPLHLPVLNGS